MKERDMERKLEDMDRKLEDIEEKITELLNDYENSKKEQTLKFSDLVQELIGALIIALPFSLTEEIWELASRLSLGRVFLIFFITVLVVYLFLRFSKLQNWAMQNVFGFIPLRLITSLSVSLLVSLFSILLFGIYPDFLSSPEQVIKATLLVTTFAVIGSLGLDMAK
ncbi:DUF2391 family protein [Aquifex sp.]